MTLTGHWNRINKRVEKLWPQNVLEQEKQKLQEKRELYRGKVDCYLANGGSIDWNHDFVFEFIVRESLTEIQWKIDSIGILGTIS
jgi:hypothetical protein